MQLRTYRFNVDFNTSLLFECPDYGSDALVGASDEDEQAQENDEGIFDNHVHGDATGLLWLGDQLDKRREHESQGCAADGAYQRYEEAELGYRFSQYNCKQNRQFKVNCRDTTLEKNVLLLRAMVS